LREHKRPFAARTFRIPSIDHICGTSAKSELIGVLRSISSQAVCRVQMDSRVQLVARVLPMCVGMVAIRPAASEGIMRTLIGKNYSEEDDDDDDDDDEDDEEEELSRGRRTLI
jgi:hypothetical protein